MSRGLKGDKRIIQALALPVSLGMAPVPGVTGDAVNELVMSDILRTLVCITTARARSSDQRQPDGVVVRLVRSVLAIGQNGRAEFATHVCQVAPLVRRHFEFLRLSCAPLDRANVPVVGGHLVRSCQWKRCLQVGLFGIPVDYVCEFNALSSVARRKPDRLHKLGTRGFTRNFHGHARRAMLHYANPRRTSDVSLRLRLL